MQYLLTEEEFETLKKAGEERVQAAQKAAADPGGAGGAVPATVDA